MALFLKSWIMKILNPRKILNHKLTPILILVLIALIVGLLVVNDFGASVDEKKLRIYGKESLASYAYWLDHSKSPQLGPTNHKYYGPAFMMAVELAIRIMLKLGLDPDINNVWHFSYFLVFLLGVICLYLLLRRWFNHRTSFLVVVLFITQPLLLGHSFINPKDTPFMSLLIICIYFGIRMIDSIPAGNNEVDLKTRFYREWTKLVIRRRIYLGIIVFILTIISLLRIVFPDYLYSIVNQIVKFFYNTQSSAWYGNIFSSLVSQGRNLPLIKYTNKARQIVDILSTPVYLLISTGFTITCVRLLFPARKPIPIILKAIKPLISIPVITTGFLIGFTTSLRVIGPFAGLIIAVLALIKHRRRSIPYLLGICIWAILICYFTWPYLWSSPIRNFFSSLSMMSVFPFKGTTLFNGVEYHVFELPYSYVAVLMGIQFTEPIVVLFCIGFLIFIWQSRVKPLQNELFVLFFLWFFLPFIYFIFSHSQLYDNFRQLLFMIPPIFFMVGLFMEKMLARIRSRAIYWGIAVVLLFPGIYAGINLHPYEYTYYNSFIGGTGGAFRRFELDYWRTSFSELAKEVNRVAPKYSKVVVWRAIYTIDQELRSDLIVENGGFNDFIIDNSNDYAILSSRWRDDARYPYAPILATVERDGAVFSVLKYVKGISP
jgi:hypothetical protein